MTSTDHPLKRDKGWDKALAEEDCLQVKKLLDQDAALVNKRWKERTALHVAARRGDVKLVEKILDVHAAQTGSSESSILEVVDQSYKLDALAMAVINGNREIVNLLKEASRVSASNPYNIDTEADDGSAKGEPNLRHYIDEKAAGFAREVDGGKTDGAAKESELDFATSEVSLKEITQDVLKWCPKIEQVKSLYDKDCDFNFLDINLFLFHFSFSAWQTPERALFDAIRKIQEDLFAKARERKILRYLLVKLRDGQGRPVLHVAVDSQKVTRFLELIDKPTDSKEKIPSAYLSAYLNVSDSVGRTPLYRAVAQKRLLEVTKCLLADERIEIEKEVKYRADQWGPDLDMDGLSSRNGFKGECVFIRSKRLKSRSFSIGGSSMGVFNPLEEISFTPLHVAIIHENEKAVGELLPKVPPRGTEESGFTAVDCRRRFTWPVVASSANNLRVRRSASPMQLAVLRGSISILQRLLEAHDAEQKLSKRHFHPSSIRSEATLVESFFLAAAMGNAGIIKAFLDSKGGKFDPTLLKDPDGNTPLHYALLGKYVRFRPHLVDFVSCRHLFQCRQENDEQLSLWLAHPQDEDGLQPESVEGRKEKDKNEKYGQRRVSISLLLEAGISVWERNKEHNTASPQPNAPEEFLEWWSKKVTQEIQQEQQKLNASAAANAVSVTAALVATASYVGPLTPPLGYGGEPASLQVHILAIRIFVVCDTLSFYLALAAIMLALVPALPMPGGSMRELVRTRMLLLMAVSCLFPSIICVFVAFAAGYSAVIPADGLAHHGLTVATTVTGGTLCFLVLYIFVVTRWVKVIRGLDRREVRIFLEELFSPPVVSTVIYIYDHTLGPVITMIRNPRKSATQMIRQCCGDRKQPEKQPLLSCSIRCTCM
ncbi:unnamed protein product [Calypogeia fissa]